MTEEAKIQKACERVLQLVGELGVAYDRELRYRLEGEFPHDTVGEAVKKLSEEGKIKRTHLRGRRRAGEAPNVFYRLPGSDYRTLEPLMRKKLDLSIFVSNLSRDMGYYAELLWWEAFKRNGWDVYPREQDKVGKGMREYGGLVASVDNDIDFVVVKNGIAYGVEVKNGLSYPKDLYWKVYVAIELGLVPLIIARWLNPRQVYLLRMIKCPFVIYREAIYSETYASMVEEVRKYLGFPIEDRSKVDDEYFQRKIRPIHRAISKGYPETLEAIRSCWVKLQGEKDFRTGLGDKKKSR